VKSTFVSKDVSCIPPENYADRFIKFMLQSLEWIYINLDIIKNNKENESS
jgi:hypothetical protein